MRKRILYLCCGLVLCGCSSVKDFHTYKTDNTFKLKAEFEDVWEEVIDYVATSNYEITNIEKASGLITIIPCSFKAAYQIKGKQDDNYYYAVQYYRKYKNNPVYVVSNWNIHVKPIDHYTTSISVNLLNNGKVVIVDKDKEINVNLANHTTGTFEKSVLYNIMDNLRKKETDVYDWKQYTGESH